MVDGRVVGGRTLAAVTLGQRDESAVAHPSSTDSSAGGYALRALRTALATFLGVCLVLLFVGAVFLAMVTRQTEAGVPSAFGQRALIVLSGSMTGTFDTGDLIFDRDVTASQASHLHKGQVISFQEVTPSGQVAAVITHRIYRVEHVLNTKTQAYTVAYETKGDANPVADRNRVLPEEVLGVYETRIPDAGYVLGALRQPPVFVILISLPFAVLVLLEARRRWNGVKREG